MTSNLDNIHERAAKPKRGDIVFVDISSPDALLGLPSPPPPPSQTLSTRVGYSNAFVPRKMHPVCCCTVPLWLGCVLLCTLLVALVGFAPFATNPSGSGVIVTEARNSYNMVLAMTGAVLYEKFTNEGITTILATSHAAFKPPSMLSPNISDPLWDRDWQLFFSGVAATAPQRRFYYMDFATGYFTGQHRSVGGAVNMRIAGRADDTEFTAYLQSTAPPFHWNPVDTISLLFPPMLLFSNVSTAELQTFILPSLDTDGSMIYGYARYVANKTLLSDPVSPLGISGLLLELIPLEEVVNVVGAQPSKVARFGGDSIILDSLGALVSCTLPALSNIYLPVGTPGAICTSVVYANVTASKCRHSLQTIQPIWPIVYDAHLAVTTRPESTQVVNWAVNVSYATFFFDGEEYLVSGSSPLVGRDGWWAAAITPIKPVYGPFVANRNRVAGIVAAVCVGMALTVLVCTYMLLLPLGRLMNDMIAALRLQTQSDRFARTAATSNANDQPSHPSGASFSGIICGRDVRLQVSELRDIELAVASLHELLEGVAKVLPPPVIQAVRNSMLSYREGGGNASQHLAASLSSVDDVSSSLNTDAPPTLFMGSSEPSMARIGAFAAEFVTSTDACGADREHVAHMLAWFEEYYRIRRHASPSTRNEQGSPRNALPTVVTTDPSSHSILIRPSVSLRPARRRGYFIAVSLTHIRESSRFSDAIAPILSTVWQHGGEVELIEGELLLATFGCYDARGDASDRAVLCAIDVAEHWQQLQPSSPRGDDTSKKVCERQRGRPVSTAMSVAVDCGWFETYTFTCALPSGAIMRSQVLQSTARDVAVRMLPLGMLLNERILISGDVLRHLSPDTVANNVPIVVDHLKFDSRAWSKLSRRKSVIVFSMTCAKRSPSGAPASLLSYIMLEVCRCDAQMVSDGFHLMMKAQYSEAKAHLKHCIGLSLRSGRPTNPAMSRLLKLCSFIILTSRESSLFGMKPYLRNERTVFGVFQGEGEHLDDHLEPDAAPQRNFPFHDGTH